MDNLVTVKINYEGVGEILKSQEVQDLIGDYARRLTPEFENNGYQSSVFVGTKRANARITAVTLHAKRSNLKHNTLLKAISSGGGQG